jgi:putative NIF3 family GTP cyclohydrolase 1 type 2
MSEQVKNFIDKLSLGQAAEAGEAFKDALRNKVDAYITADLGYHDFFEPDGKLLLADIGHFESEQYTSELLEKAIKEKFPTFAVQKTGRNTNPVNYFL